MQVHIFPTWFSAPFLRWLLPFLGGLYTAEWVSFYYATLGLSLSLGILIAWNFLRPSYKIKSALLPGLLLFIAVFCLGRVVWQTRSLAADSHYSGHIPEGRYSLVCTIVSSPVMTRAHHRKWLAKWESVYANGGWKACRGYCWIYMKKEFDAVQYPLRSRVILRADMKRIPHSGNPGAFEYADYAQRQGISHTSWIQPAQCLLVDSSRWHPAQTLGQLQAYLKHALYTSLRDSVLAGFATALLMGDKAGLSEDLTDTYMRTGLMHVIAISGMHLNLIFWCIQRLGDTLGKGRKAKDRVALMAIPLLWIFTLLTGAGASIVRAAIMCTLMIFGSVGRSPASLLNSWSAAAFIMLCWEPNWAYDAGCILSFGALLSLFLFQPILQKICVSPNPLIHQLGGLTAASMAAQFMTLPYAVFLFHQFPLYFLFANLWAVPLSSLILILLILLVLCFPIAWLSSWIAVAVSQSLKWMNAGVATLSQWPFALWQPLQIDLSQMWLGTAVMLCLYAWYKERSNAWFWLTAGLTALIFFIRTKDVRVAEGRHALWIPYGTKLPAMVLLEGRQATVWTDTILHHDSYARDQIFNPAFISLRTHSIQLYELPKSSLLQFKIKDQSVCWCYGGKPPPLVQAPILLLSKQYRYWSLRTIAQTAPRLLILDTSVPSWLQEKWINEADSLRLPLHVISREGACWIPL